MGKPFGVIGAGLLAVTLGNGESHATSSARIDTETAVRRLLQEPEMLPMPVRRPFGFRIPKFDRGPADDSPPPPPPALSD